VLLVVGLFFLLLVGNVDASTGEDFFYKGEVFREKPARYQRDLGDYFLNKNPYGGEVITWEDHREEVVFFSQRDDRWRDITYGEGTVGGSGCVPTALAMVLSYNGYKADPAKVAEFAKENGHVASYPKYGTKFSLFRDMAQSKGLKCTDLESTEEIIEHLLKGRPVVVVGRGAPYNSGEIAYGHALVLTGFIEGMVFYAHDPNVGPEIRIPIKEIEENFPEVAKVIY